MSLVRLLLSIVVLTLTVASTTALAEDYSPYSGEDFPRNVYFGDTHVHSSWSADAGNMGNRRIGPDEVYRFARGETVTAHNGEAVRLKRPLDFLLLSDHAEYLGLEYERRFTGLEPVARDMEEHVLKWRN